MSVLLVIVALSVAFLNGANDNIKGFAAVWGAGLMSYLVALSWLATLPLAAVLSRARRCATAC